MCLAAAGMSPTNAAVNARPLDWGAPHPRGAMPCRQYPRRHDTRRRDEGVHGRRQKPYRRWSAADLPSGRPRSPDPLPGSAAIARGDGPYRKPESRRSSSRCHSSGDARCHPPEDPSGPAAARSPDPAGRGSIAGSDQALHIPWREVARQRSQTPMSHGGDGGIQPDSALALGDQETQEHAKCVGTIFGRPPPARTTLFENKRSQSACIKPAWFLSNPPEQLANVNAVVVEGHITDTPLLVHPLTEGRQQSRIVRFDRS